MSVFDSDSFLDATTQEALVRRPPLPVGSDYIGTLGEPKTRKGEKDGKPWTAVDFPVEIDLSTKPDIQKEMGGLAKVTLKVGVMLDINDGGMIDWGVGKNNRLRRLREAVGMNVPGQSFNIRAMQGRLVRVSVKHREHEGEMFDEVDAVSKA